MIQATTTIKPIRRLKRICEGLPHKALYAAGRAGIYYTSPTPDNFIWTAIGNLPKQQIERIFAHAEAMYLYK